MQLVGQTVCHDHIGLLLEHIQVTHHAGLEELIGLQHGLVHHHLDPFGLDAFHHTLDGRGAKVVRPGLHDQPEDPHHLG